MPWALLLLPLGIALAVAGPRLGKKGLTLAAWGSWVLAWGLLFGLPSFPPHTALDHRLVLAPLLLIPMLLPQLRPGLKDGVRPWVLLAGSAVLVLSGSLQSLWSRSELWESALILVLTLAALLGTDGVLQRSQRPWLLPLLGVGVGLILALNCSLRLGIEALVIGITASLLRGQAVLLRGSLLALASILAAACAYAEALPLLPMIGTSVLAAGVLRKRAPGIQALGVGLPLLTACIPGAIGLITSPP